MRCRGNGVREKTVCLPTDECAAVVQELIPLLTKQQSLENGVNK